jgi:hypothetical protein
MMKKILVSELIGIALLLSSCAIWSADNAPGTSQTFSSSIVSSELTSGETDGSESIISTEPLASEPKSMASTDEIVPIFSGDEFVADIYGKVEKLEYQVEDKPDSDLQILTMKVGSASISLENEGFDDKCYILTMDTPFGGYPVFLVHSFRMESVQTDLIVYFEGQLFHAGVIPEISLGWYTAKEGCLSIEFLNMETLYTLASTDTYWDDPVFALTEVPQGMKAYGNIVTVSEEFPVYSMRYGEQVDWMALPGDVLVLSANDSIETIFIQSLDRSQSGWIRYDKDSGEMVLSDGSTIDMYQAFSGFPSWG